MCKINQQNCVKMSSRSHDWLILHSSSGPRLHSSVTWIKLSMSFLKFQGVSISKFNKIGSASRENVTGRITYQYTQCVLISVCFDDGSYSGLLRISNLINLPIQVTICSVPIGRLFLQTWKPELVFNLFFQFSFFMLQSRSKLIPCNSIVM